MRGSVLPTAVLIWLEVSECVSIFSLLFFSEMCLETGKNEGKREDKNDRGCVMDVFVSR